MTHPACFPDAASYAVWATPVRGMKFSREHGYCADCTPQYQKLMLQQGRCEYPGVTFRPYFGDVTGCRSPDEVRAAKNSKRKS